MADGWNPVNAAKRGIYKGLAALVAFAFEGVIGKFPIITEGLTALTEILMFAVVRGPGADAAASWSAAIFIGVIAGDAVALLRGEKPPVGPTIGIVRGLGAVLGGLLALAIEAIAFVPLAVLLGIFVGEIIGDATDRLLSVLTSSRA